MERNEIFTFQDVTELHKEFNSYLQMYNAPETDYIWSDEENDFIYKPNKVEIVNFNEWLQFYVEGWSNDEIISGVQAHSIEE